MALKGNRHIVTTDISFFMNEVAERGGVVVYSTSGSGAALDQSASLVTYAASASGNKPIGLLLGDMVNLDQTRQHTNRHKDEVQIGGKVPLLVEGWVTTNKIATGVNPTGGQTAYLVGSGLLSNVIHPTAPQYVATPAVGQFMSRRDEDGYAKVYIKLPGRAE